MDAIKYSDPDWLFGNSLIASIYIFTTFFFVFIESKVAKLTVIYRF